MRIDFVAHPFVKTRSNKEIPVLKETKNTVSAPDKLSYLDIPKIAFSGKIIRGPEDEKQKLGRLNAVPIFINARSSRFNLEKPQIPALKEVQMFVYPQDPLVSKPELVNLSSEKGFLKGPEGERVKIVDYGRPLAEPNERGNFIYPANTNQFDQANAFALVNKTLSMYEDLLGRKVKWGFDRDQLQLYPHAGKMMNAYYSRKDAAIKLFEFVRPDTGKTVKTCQSSDIVSHETGHAVLDGLKPKFLENFGFGVAGFHEAFADTSAMLLGLQNDGLINRMLEVTKGDLTKENVIASLAEEFGDAIHKNDYDPTNDHIQYLRNAINFFKQKPYKEMPYRDRMNDDTVLGLESHSYSRLFLGANYDILVGLYDKNKPGENIDTQKFALMKARDNFAKLFARAIDFSPAGEVDFKDMAIAMIKADIIDNKGQNLDVIEKVFVDRNILKPEDVSAVKEEMNALPQIKLPEGLTSPANILQFVNDNREALGIPSDIRLKPEEAYINSKGEKHVVLTYDNPTILQGPEFGRYQGQMVNILGTAALNFDQDGNLINNTFKKIDKQVKEDVLYAISLMIQNMRVQGDQGDEGLKTHLEPQLLLKKSELGDYNEIVKQAFISDPINPEKRGIKSLGEYFNKLKNEASSTQ
jgi:hypothetical protein